AAAMRLPMLEIARDYETETGQKVVINFGPSQTILATLELSKKGDLFLPADESYVGLAKKKDLVDEVTNLASMRAVVIVRPGFPSEINTWDDFLAKGVKLGLPNPESTAIGKLTKAHLEKTGKWAAVEERKPSYLGDINQVGNSVANVGSSDAGIVFDAIAVQLQQKKPDMKIVKLKELENVKAQIQVALTKFSEQPGNARRFVDFIRHKDKGAAVLAKHGYSNIESAAVAAKRPKLLVYAGSMLQPAIEQSLKDFEKRENVEIDRVYNGCGILVGQMKTGAMPDIYFACDTSFMLKVKDQFEQPTNVSNNQLMIIVKKGNPKEVFELRDIAKQLDPRLRVGIGHEHQCAMGALT
ncbi:MAG TPA: molybdate ABC transporter substrate-binding protein, partial [bacterium]|nr:molybdate ABC transporter substrate-binding protein [bacterium]